jgi:translation initiation factor IF-2
MQKDTTTKIERPPVVAVMGHIDHGKSTLLDYIRKTNIVETEAGGITQRISAYEVVHKTKEGQEKKITFLDTPGHEAFGAMRARGAKVADIAILVVAADDGVKPQTVDALKTILKAEIPYIVAINKIDKEGANVDRTKVSLAENEIYVEGYGGTISSVPISAKTGEGVSDLLDTVVLAAELEELTGDPSVNAEGVIIEANLDKKKGISATLVVKNGTLKSGQFVVAGSALSPVRLLENYAGKSIPEATFSSPVRIIGWNELPDVGSIFAT